MQAAQPSGGGGHTPNVAKLLHAGWRPPLCPLRRGTEGGTRDAGRGMPGRLGLGGSVEGMPGLPGGRGRGATSSMPVGPRRDSEDRMAPHLPGSGPQWKIECHPRGSEPLDLAVYIASRGTSHTVEGPGLLGGVRSRSCSLKVGESLGRDIVCFNECPCR